jgi:hypothetical protein
MALKYSVYYRIQQRDSYFERFFRKFSKQFSADIKEAARDKYEELMEIIVQYILDENKLDLNILLTKQNAKVARIFFDYLTVSNIKNKKKCDIASRIDEIFIEESKMKDFKEFLAEKMTEINLLDDLDKPERIKLSEAEDDDPFADDAGSDDDMDTDTGDDSDPFGDDLGGSDGPGGSSGGSKDGDEEDGEKTDDENSTEADKKADELDLEGHEDDPDFLKGATDGDDVTLSDKPSGECIYDVDGIMKAIAAVIQGTNETDLEEIVAVKKAVELIFNGKILKPEDVQFTNTQNAAFLIKKIGEKVDEKTKNYLMVKIKEPLIKQRDQQKLDIVALKKDVNAARDTIQDLDQA